MQLIIILLVTVSILTFLSGATVLFGSSKGDRLRSAWFFLATFFATLWMVAIAIFLTATPEMSNVDLWVKLTFVSAIMLDVAFLGYIAWREKFGKILTFIFLVFGLTVSGIIICCPQLLFNEIALSATGNTVTLNIDALYITYITFFATIVPAVIFYLFKQFQNSTSKKKRKSDIVIMISFAISSIIVSISDVILPLLGRWDMIWLGPLALSATIIAFYYTILRYRSINLVSSWLKLFSFIVISTSLAIVYMIIFSIIFAAMFRGATPSTEVIILNFAMILIVISLLPAINELSMFIRSLIYNQQIDMAYIIKKLTRLPSKEVNLRDLASFLAEHLHVEYVGFLIDNQVWGSSSRKMDSEDVKMLDLIDNNGKAYGKFMLGKPAHKGTFSRGNLVEIETIVNLVALIVSTRRIK